MNKNTQVTITLPLIAWQHIMDSISYDNTDADNEEYQRGIATAIQHQIDQQS